MIRLHHRLGGCIYIYRSKCSFLSDKIYRLRNLRGAFVYCFVENFVDVENRLLVDYLGGRHCCGKVEPELRRALLPFPPFLRLNPTQFRHLQGRPVARSFSAPPRSWDSLMSEQFLHPPHLILHRC